MINKRRIFLLTTMIISLSFCFQVKSYTMAKVNNSAIFSVTSSDNALIAIPDNVSLDISKDITNTYVKTMKDEIEKGVSNIETEVNTEVVTKLVDNNFSITNNMSDLIDVRVFIDNRFDNKKVTDISVIDNKINNNRMIKPGEKKDISFNVNNNIDSQYLDVIISAKWNGGTAEIKKSIKVNVDTKVMNSEIRKDMRTPIKIENVNNEEIQTENQELSVDTNLLQVEDQTPDIIELPHDNGIPQKENNEIL